MDPYLGIMLVALTFVATIYFYEKMVDDLEQEVSRLKTRCGLTYEPPSVEDDDEW